MELLAPRGLSGFLTTFIASGQYGLLGWIALADRRDSAELLALFRGELDALATLAGETLSKAIALAEGCGARVRRADADRIRLLSPREREVVRLVAEGMSDLEIAGALNISEQTVGSHLRRIYSKLSVHSRGELTKEAGALAMR